MAEIGIGIEIERVCGRYAFRSSCLLMGEEWDD